MSAHSLDAVLSSFRIGDLQTAAFGGQRGEIGDFWTSKASMDLEDRLIWSREWIAIGYGAQLPNAGDILPFTVGHHGIHVERMPGGEIVARFNFVQHGGCRSIPLQCQTGTRTRCSYLSCGYSRDRVEGFPTSLNRSDPAAHHFLGFAEVPGLPMGLRLKGDVIFVNLDASLAVATSEAFTPFLDGPAESLTLEPACNWKQFWLALLAEFGKVETIGATFSGRSEAGLRLRAQPPNFFVLDYDGGQMSAILQPTGTMLTLLRLARRGEAGPQPALDLLERCGQKARSMTPMDEPGRNDLQRAMLDWFEARLMPSLPSHAREGAKG